MNTKEFRSKMLAAWNGKPPKVEYRAEPMPGTPHLRLLGDGCSTVCLDKFLSCLESDYRQQKGKFYTFPLKSDKAEEDIYYLEGWEVFTSTTSALEAMVVLYYSAMYPYQVIKKYMGESMAQQYLDEITERERAIASLENLM